MWKIIFVKSCPIGDQGGQEVPKGTLATAAHLFKNMSEDAGLQGGVL